MEAAKHDASKVPLSLLPPGPLAEIARVLEFGAAKYGKGNWRKGMAWTRLLDAALRHLADWQERLDPDAESGRTHLAHAAACLIFLLEYQAKGLGTDDRFGEPPCPNPSPTPTSS